MRNVASVIILSGSMLLARCVSSQAKVDDIAWEHVKHFHRDRSFVFVDRRFVCNNGRIARVTDRAISLKRPDHTEVTIERKDLLRITVSELRVRGILYSGRSSWVDVASLFQESSSYRREKVLVATLSGKTQSGQLVEADDSHLTILTGARRQPIAKSNVSKVYYITVRQLSDRAEYVFGEDPWLAIFDPEAWPLILGANRVPVLLYDSSKPENNEAIACSLEL